MGTDDLTTALKCKMWRRYAATGTHHDYKKVFR